MRRPAAETRGWPGRSGITRLPPPFAKRGNTKENSEERLSRFPPGSGASSRSSSTPCSFMEGYRLRSCRRFWICRPRPSGGASRLLAAGLVEESSDILHVTPLAYPAVREFLMNLGFLADGL